VVTADCSCDYEPMLDIWLEHFLISLHRNRRLRDSLSIPRASRAVCYYYTRDRTGAHPQRQLARYAGILQDDAYSGYHVLYAAGRKPGSILEAACWAHARRPFFKEARLSRTPLAVDIVIRIDAIFAAERVIWGRSASERSSRGKSM
jgi:hypothetical protein